MVTEAQFESIQVRELNWWAHFQGDPRVPWQYYDRQFLPFLRKFDIVADVGCGPVPYFCNHNVIFDEAVAIDPLMEGYLRLERYRPYRNGVTFRIASDTEEICCSYFEGVFAFNMLDHCQDPDFTLGELTRILRRGGLLFLFVDVDKEPDAMHPHKINGGGILEWLERRFVVELDVTLPSWKFKNDVMYFVGEKK